MTKRWILYSAIALVFVLPRVDAADSKPLGVCDAAKTQSPAQVLVTGTAQSTKEGLIVADLSCPVFRFRKILIPAAVAVKVRSFGSDQIKAQFSAISPSLDSPQLRVVVRGTIECKGALRFNISDDGRDVTGGSGYGAHGFYKCSMTDAKLESVELLKNH